MSEKFENIDDLFREELENYSPEVPAGAWDGISAQLATNKPRKAIPLFVYKIAAGLALLLASGALTTILLQEKPETTQNNTTVLLNNDEVEQGVVAEEKKADISSDRKNKRDEGYIAPNKEIEGELATANKVTTIFSKPSPTGAAAEQESLLRNKKLILAENHSNNSAGVVSKRNNVEKQGFFNRISGVVPNTVPNEEIITSPEESEENTFVVNEDDYEEIVYDEGRTDKKWMIGGQAGPQYSYRNISSSYRTKELLDKYDSKEDGLVAYAGGINIEFSPVRRLSIQSGIYYAKMGQQKSAEQYRPNRSVSYSLRLNSNYTEKESTSSYKVSNSTGNIVFNNISNRSSGAEEENKLASNELQGPSSDFSQTNNSSSISLSQYFEYIEIPVIARYSIIDRKFGVHLLGGLSTNILIGNAVYLNNRQNERIGYTEGVKAYNYSSTVGFGLGYTMTEHLKISLEPQLKYYLSSQVSNSDIDVRPYTVGIMTGIKYLF